MDVGTLILSVRVNANDENRIVGPQICCGRVFTHEYKNVGVVVDAIAGDIAAAPTERPYNSLILLMFERQPQYAL